MKSSGELWRCASCGREFANRNQSHFCARYTLDHHFAGKPPLIRELFDGFLAELTCLGLVKVLPQKTRIAFQVRMSFAQLSPRQGWIDGHLVLAERTSAAMFRNIQTISPRNHVHAFRLTSLEQIDAEFRSMLKKAYAVGEQRHLDRSDNQPQERG